MSKERIVKNIQAAFERRDCYVPEKEIIKLVEKNYDELKDWGYEEFAEFANDLCAEWDDFEALKNQYDLK